MLIRAGEDPADFLVILPAGKFAMILSVGVGALALQPRNLLKLILLT